MPKIIDSFLFFQELDLLEIRLSYLDKYVDTFVIVEACQTFTGKPKGFVFESNKDRFEKFSHKIEYYKIEDFHENYASIVRFLTQKNTPSHKKILEIMSGHDHYSKSEMHWVLDSYHRECLHIALDRCARNNDFVIISDLDELPSIESFSKEQKEKEKVQPYVYKQKEFRYYLNYYKDNNWFGSICSCYVNLKSQSFNVLRMDSKKERRIICVDPFERGGYHFTSCGGIEMLKKKIQSWGHQEFNNSLILSNLEGNIKEGRDIFMRESGTNLIRVALEDRKFYDSEIQIILKKYTDLISIDELNVYIDSYLHRIHRKAVLIMFKIIYKIKSHFNRII